MLFCAQCSGRRRSYYSPRLLQVKGQQKVANNMNWFLVFPNHALPKSPLSCMCHLWTMCFVCGAHGMTNTCMLGTLLQVSLSVPYAYKCTVQDVYWPVTNPTMSSVHRKLGAVFCCKNEQSWVTCASRLFRSLVFKLHMLYVYERCAGWLEEVDMVPLHMEMYWLEPHSHSNVDWEWDCSDRASATQLY